MSSDTLSSDKLVAPASSHEDATSTLPAGNGACTPSGLLMRLVVLHVAHEMGYVTCGPIIKKSSTDLAKAVMADRRLNAVRRRQADMLTFEPDSFMQGVGPRLSDVAAAASAFFTLPSHVISEAAYNHCMSKVWERVCLHVCGSEFRTAWDDATSVAGDGSPCPPLPFPFSGPASIEDARLSYELRLDEKDLTTFLLVTGFDGLGRTVVAVVGNSEKDFTPQVSTERFLLGERESPLWTHWPEQHPDWAMDLGVPLPRLAKGDLLGCFSLATHRDRNEGDVVLRAQGALLLHRGASHARAAEFVAGVLTLWAATGRVGHGLKMTNGLDAAYLVQQEVFRSMPDEAIILAVRMKDGSLRTEIIRLQGDYMVRMRSRFPYGDCDQMGVVEPSGPGLWRLVGRPWRNDGRSARFHDLGDVAGHDFGMDGEMSLLAETPDSALFRDAKRIVDDLVGKDSKARPLQLRLKDCGPVVEGQSYPALSERHAELLMLCSLEPKKSLIVRADAEVTHALKDLMDMGMMVVGVISEDRMLARVNDLGSKALLSLAAAGGANAPLLHLPSTPLLGLEEAARLMLKATVRQWHDASTSEVLVEWKMAKTQFFRAIRQTRAGESAFQREMTHMSSLALGTERAVAPSLLEAAARVAAWRMSEVLYAEQAELDHDSEDLHQRCCDLWRMLPASSGSTQAEAVINHPGTGAVH